MASQVTVYTKPGCRPCKRIIETLQQFGVEMEIVDLEDPQFSDAKTYVTEVLGARSTPVVVSDSHPPIIGYQPEKIKQLVSDLTQNERNA